MQKGETILAAALCDKIEISTSSSFEVLEVYI
jgi:hypothetical protein